MAHRITLSGGPGDGRSFMWNGGDQLQFRSGTGIASFPSETFDEARDIASEVPTLYRQSLITSSIYVWQP